MKGKNWVVHSIAEISTSSKNRSISIERQTTYSSSWNFPLAKISGIFSGCSEQTNFLQIFIMPGSEIAQQYRPNGDRSGKK